MNHHQKPQQKGQQQSMTFEGRKTLTMTWEGLANDEDDDDRFFESFERLSSAVSIDLASSGSDDDDEYDDGRISFASAMSSAPTIEELRAFEPIHHQSGPGSGPTVFGDYNMWMSEPGSIKERRRRLFQDMGLSSNKNLLSLNSTKLNKTVPQETANFSENNLKKSVSKKVCSDEKEKDPNHIPTQEESKQKALKSMEVMLVRSRSDGDIDTSSINTRMRKEELVGTVSKQRLTRTSSTLLTPQAGLYQYANTMRVSPNRTKNVTSSNKAMSSILSQGQFGAFFLIKDLDSGKEFIVKEFNNDGMWNRLSEVQTGKQLTMEEFEKSVGYSPVVKELMRRENVSRSLENGRKNSYFSKSFRNSKRRGVALLKNIKGVAHSISGSTVEKEQKEQNVMNFSPPEEPKINNKNLTSKWVKVRQQGKSMKEFTAMHLCQEIQAHKGSIWTIRFSQDSRYLASAGEDRVVHVWEVQECEVMRPVDDTSTNLSDNQPSLEEVSPFPSEKRKDRPMLAELPPMPSEKKRRGRASNKKKGNSIPDYVYVPETVFSLSEKPVCTFMGHLDDVLDLSWSKTQLLLSASMDKTVRLWDMETKSCLKLFAHNDYVTCIQFNPIDDNYFISGSLDEKIRVWNIPDRQLVDYTDLHEMVTAACYTPDGQGALIGSHKGGCRLYSTADCSLEQKEQIELRHRKKNQAKKITGFEFAPGNPSEVLVTSADSRIRIVDGTDVVHKLRGFRNTSSQISASFSADGRYVISASEDSQVYIWKREELRNSNTGKSSKGSITTFSHEHFPCKDVSVATPWAGNIKNEPPVVEIHSKRHSKRFVSPNASPSREENVVGTSSRRMLPPLPKKSINLDRSPSCHDEEQKRIQVSRVDNEAEKNSRRHLPPRPKKHSNLDEDFTKNTNYQDEDFVQEIPEREEPAQVSSADPEEGTTSKREVPTFTKKVNILGRAPSTQNEDLRRVSRIDSENGFGDSFASDSSSIRYNDPSSISASGSSGSQSWSSSWSTSDGNTQGGNTIQATAWGMVIVTAGLGGEIRAYQNLGLPVKVGRQTNLFRDLT